MKEREREMARERERDKEKSCLLVFHGTLMGADNERDYIYIE